MKYKNFEDFLRSKHAKTYTGTDDEMIDDFDRWVSKMEPYTMLSLAYSYAQIIRKEREGVKSGN